jgi:glycosyltransferase involved in cell wall biosynthesis
VRIIHINTINQVANMHARGLAPLGHTSEIVQPSMAGGLKPLPIKLAAMPWRMVDMVRVIPRLSPRHFDLAHIHWASYGALGLFGRIPFVVQVHGTDVRYRLAESGHRALFARISRKAGAILCTTPDLLSPVRAVCPAARYMPGPIDTALFAPPTQPAAADRPWTVFLFTRLDPIKRADLAADGIERFMARHPEVRVRMLDWGERRAEFRQRFGERVEFLPPVAPHEVPQMLQEADVVVGQFGIGALTLSELQGMSYGLPVITSFQYGAEYSAPPPLLNAESAEQITERLEEVYASPTAAAALGARARTWVIEQHSYEEVARRLEALYAEILGLAIPRPPAPQAAPLGSDVHAG